jgi:hypothetical protein
MPASKLTVSLRAVAAEMDLPNDAWTAYINRRTGELITVTDEESRAVENGDDADDLPDWQAEHLPKVREALASDDFLPLPSKFDIHEYSIMRRFCEQVADTKARDDLLRAIKGSGAFGRFKVLAGHCGMIDEWYAFRDRKVEDIAAEWLEANGIAYARDGSLKRESDA